jgi:hypothetical protein
MKEEIAKVNIVVEGHSDLALLQKLLIPVNGYRFQFEAADSINEAITMAGTLRHAVHQNVIMVIDSDGDRNNSDEEFIRELVGKDGENFKLLKMIPEIESLYFVDKSALSNALGEEIDDMIWDIGLSAPKAALDALLKNLEKTTGQKKLAIQLLNYTPLLQAMRNHPKIKEIQEFAQVAHA